MKFIYQGKIKDFVLSKKYTFQTPLNNGDEFDLEENDLALMKNCLAAAKFQGIAPENSSFVPVSLAQAIKDQKELESVSAPVETRKVKSQTVLPPDPQDKESDKEFSNKEEIVPEDTVDLNTVRKDDLLNICKEKKIAVPDNATKAVLIELINQNK